MDILLLFAWVGGLYAAYGLLFILVVTVIVISEITFLEFENGTGATWTLVLAGIAVVILTNRQWSWAGVLASLPGIAVFLVAYFLIGACWSVVKWYFFTRVLREAYGEALKTLIAKKGSTDKASILNQMRAVLHYRYPVLSIPPEPAEHTNRILTWIGHWPFSMLWTLINDPVRRIVRWLYQRLKNVYRAIGRSAFADIDVREDADL